jgi:hypothetical protein
MTYYDRDNNSCSFRQMIKREPEWVESRFHFMENKLKEIYECRYEIDKLYLLASRAWEPKEERHERNT